MCSDCNRILVCGKVRVDRVCKCMNDVLVVVRGSTIFVNHLKLFIYIQSVCVVGVQGAASLQRSASTRYKP